MFTYQGLARNKKLLILKLFNTMTYNYDLYYTIMYFNPLNIHGDSVICSLEIIMCESVGGVQIQTTGLAGVELFWQKVAH